jgi:hypothetical protein
VCYISLLLKMIPFKSSFRFQGAKKETDQPNITKNRTSSGCVSNGFSHDQPKSELSSIYLEGDFRMYSEENIKEMRGKMMLEQLHNEQSRRLWYTWGPSQGVVLKMDRGKYAACPPQLEAESGGLFDQIVTMNTQVRSVLLIQSFPHQTDFSLNSVL